MTARRDDGAALDHAQRLRGTGRVRVAGDKPEVAVRDRDARPLEIIDPGPPEVRRTHRLDEAVEPVSETGEHRAQAFVLFGRQFVHRG